MKIGRLIALGLVSLGALELYKNRKTIKDSYQNTKNETDSAKLKLERIKNDLAIISQEKEKIRLISQERRISRRYKNIYSKYKKSK